MSTFANWSAADVAAYNRRNAMTPAEAEMTMAMNEIAVEREADLHEEIEDELKKRGWYYVHSRMDRATTQAKGVPDFIIAAPSGKSFWLEAKGKKTKVTPKQAGAILALKILGHEAYIVRSMDDFRKAVDGNPGLGA